MAHPAAPPDKALIVFNRFGLGARPGDRTRLESQIESDPRTVLKAELDTQDVALIPTFTIHDDLSVTGLPGSTAAIQASMADTIARRAKLDSAMAADAPAKPTPISAEQKLFQAEAQGRFDKALQVEIGFVERLVSFWSNHFCVSAAKDNIVRASAGAFEREAIRPFVLGRFSDMLLAVERHPAMLYFLDNHQSIGPDSRSGGHGKHGLNENLAREILELHTLGVDGGYTQADVTAFARILTGWTMAGREGHLGQPGSFAFNANAHQPGDQSVMGKTYPAGGVGQAEAVLNDVARHPATAQHIATKLARHFISDDPPPAAVARLAKAFTAYDGNLRAMAMTLIDMPEAWSQPLNKMRSPLDYMLAMHRAVGTAQGNDPIQTLYWLTMLGEPLWQPPEPNGFPDTAAAHASPAGMKVRLDIAWQAARQIKVIGDPNALVTDIIGPSASPETRQAVARAESRQQAVALLLMSPEFQRR